jgi:signal transduction histidine kinase
VVALILGLFLSDYFFFPVKVGAHLLDTVRLLRYIFTASLGIGLIEVLHHSQRRTRTLVAELQDEVERRKRSEFELLKTKAQLSNYSKELERHVAARTTDLANTLRSLKGVLYHMVHNLRAPLRAMTAYTELLVADCSPKLDTTALSYAQHIQAAAKRMDTLIRDLLEYGRLGHVEIALVKVSLENVLKRTLSRLSHEVHNKRAKIEVIHPLPDVLAHEEVLEEVLNCLLENALKFVAPGTTPRVQIQAELRDSAVRLWIVDNGIGIDPRYHERIFGAFEKLHPQEGDGGTGIGLAIVKQGMERMGGRVGIGPQPGLGSRFWIEFAMPFRRGKAPD